ncbi:unnamed protein product, partial [Ixodes pacificus]
QSLLPGAATSQPGQATQPPPVTAFGGFRLQQPGPSSDTQSAFARPTPPDPWPVGTQTVEYQPTSSTHAAAAAVPEPRVFAPFAAAPDPGRFFLTPDISYNPYTAYNPQVARRQRVFTVADPPARRDIAEAFVHVQQAARHSQHIGRREVAELQMLECFVQIWDCRCIGLPARDKLRIFDRVRLLYHVAQPGWGAALEGYADPSASLLRGPLSPNAVPRHQGPSPPTGPPAPPGQAARTPAVSDHPSRQRSPRSDFIPHHATTACLPVLHVTRGLPLEPRLPPDQGLPLVDAPRELVLPEHFVCPPECVALLDSLDAPSGIPRALDLVLGPARPTAALVDGVPTLALLQDVLLP